MDPLITLRHSLVIGFDGISDLGTFQKVLAATADLSGVGAYKVDFLLGLRYGLTEVVRCALEHTSKPLIYEHHTAGNSLLRDAESFSSQIAEAGFFAVTLFPTAGSLAQRQWTFACQKKSLHVLTGSYFADLQEGGHPDHSHHNPSYCLPFTQAVGLGLREFIIPGHHPGLVGRLRHQLASIHPVFYVNRFHQVASFPSTLPQELHGLSWHVLVDSALTSNSDPRHVAEEYIRRLPDP